MNLLTIGGTPHVYIVDDLINGARRLVSMLGSVIRKPRAERMYIPVGRVEVLLVFRHSLKRILHADCFLNL